MALLGTIKAQIFTALTLLLVPTAVLALPLDKATKVIIRVTWPWKTIRRGVPLPKAIGVLKAIPNLRLTATALKALLDGATALPIPVLRSPILNRDTHLVP